ncbi:unnamed protein product [Rhizoctonia solani]|nr:unnamed protein product [Rhizoctonia solani]
MEELESAGKLLCYALNHYLGVCMNIHDLVARKGMLRNVPQNHLHRINTETDRLLSYQQKLAQAGAAIRRVRNRLSRLAPITTLPPEVLTRIFRFVASPCDMIQAPNPETLDLETPTSPSEISDADDSVEGPRSKSLQLQNFPTHLDRVTHVCFYWRWIAIGTPSLWTHIDFIPNQSLHRKLLVRAETYATRAARLPIELHIADDNPLAYDKVHFCQFLSSILSRVKSLDIMLIHSWRSFHSLVLNKLFLHPAPESTVLTKLVGSFPTADDTLNEFIDWFARTNGSFFRLTVLHLRGIFPLWQSVAYHNLVDLRLFPPRDTRRTCISEPQLQNILSASPGLRIFYFGLQITDRKQDDEPTVPVCLNDLEVLYISTKPSEDDTNLKPGYVLRLIAPGSKPFRLSIWHDFIYIDHVDDETFSLDELVKFFQRSDITKFCLGGSYSIGLLCQLLCYAPNMKNLVLDSRTSIWNSPIPFKQYDPVSFRLNSLVLHNCIPNVEEIERLLQQCSTNLLEMSYCGISVCHAGQDPVVQVRDLLIRYPDTRFVVSWNQFSDPTAGWDLVE